MTNQEVNFQLPPGGQFWPAVDSGRVLQALDEWAHRRMAIARSASAHPATYRLPVHRARPPAGSDRLRNGLMAAVAQAGLRDPAGRPLTVTPHHLRHTYATTLANAGMSLQALMALLGHVTPER